MIHFQVPAEFVHPLFYRKGDVIGVEEELSIDDVASFPFIFDMYQHNKISLNIEPWNHRDDSVKKIVNLWKIKQPAISSIHKERNKEKVMIETPSAIALYISFLFWINGKPVSNLTNLLSEMDNLTWKPVNVIERLSFILNKPYLYHSFVQLNELFMETEKLFVKVKIKEKL